MKTLSREDFLTWIKDWRRDIRLMDSQSGSYFDRHKTAVRVYAFNWLTCPSRPMTDRERAICRKFAKRIMKDLKKMQGWHETESGMLWI